MDAPRLMVKRRDGACNDCLLMGGRMRTCLHTYTEPSVEEVFAWLREQGVGEIRQAEEGYKLSTLQGVSVPKRGRYLVVALLPADLEETT